MKIKNGTLALCVAAVAAVSGLAVVAPAGAQGTTPQWRLDSGEQQNRYLTLITYFTSDLVTKWEIWTSGGDPFNSDDDYSPCPGYPWNIGRLFGAPHPNYNNPTPDTTPYANLALFRVDDGEGGFDDLVYPGDFTPVFGPPAVPLPRNQGTYAPYRVNIGDDVLEVNQELQFARDMVRIEYIVTNLGAFGQGTGGATRRVGLRLVIDPYTDYGARNCNIFARPVSSLFIPTTRERVLFEKDYGRPVGTTTIPDEPVVPDQYLVFDDDEGPDPLLTAKLIMRGNGATPPDRFAVVNTLNLFPAPGAWDYSTDFGQELRISDIGSALWWDVSEIPSGRSKSFVVYAGLGVASHGMSNAYLASQQDHTNLFTQGYVAALQAPFALPLVDGNADVDGTGTPVTFDAHAFVQNQYFFSSLPNAFAFLELPDALELADPDASRRVDMGTLAALATGPDEGRGDWVLKPTGIEAGLVKIAVTFSNAFLDSVRVEREINVPQGRLYQLGPEWRMLTFPFNFNLQQDDPASALGLPPGSFQMVHYNPQLNRYENVTRIRPGEAYWVRVFGSDGAPVFTRLENARPVRLQQTDTYLIDVKTGWNQIGNPSPYAVPVRDVGVVTASGEIVPFERAVQQSFLRPALYEYDRKTGQYVRLGLDDILQPGRGYWIFSTAPRTLTIRAPYGPGIRIS